MGCSNHCKVSHLSFYKKKLDPGTIQGYRVTLANCLYRKVQWDISHNTDLSRLIESFLWDRPRPGMLMPPWDLHGSHLTGSLLGTDGTSVLLPIVIPSLSKTLRSDLKDDKLLCPVRALCYYLDRTKDIRSSRELIFLSLKERC